MKKTITKLFTCFLAVLLVVSCLVIPEVAIVAETADEETLLSANLLDELGIAPEEEIFKNDYTTYSVGDTSAKVGWSGNTGTALSISSVTPKKTETAVNGLQFYSASANAYAYYQLPANNFVLKLNMYTMGENKGNWDIGISTDEGDQAAVITVPAYNRTVDTQAAENKFRLKNYLGTGDTYPLAKGYSLNEQNTDLSMEIVFYNGYFYFVGINGELVARTPSCAADADAHQLCLRSWGAGVVITEMSLIGLCAAEDSFASSIGAKTDDTVFYADYRGYYTSDNGNDTYKKDLSDTAGTVQISETTPYNKASKVSGLYIHNGTGSAYADIDFTAADYVAKVSYVHAAHSGGYSTVALSDETGAYNAEIALPFSNRNDNNNHFNLLAYQNNINVRTTATQSFGGCTKYVVGTDVWNFCNADVKEIRNIEATIYIYSYKGYVYYVALDQNGNQVLIHKNVAFAEEGIDRTLRLYTTWGGIVVTDLHIKSLVPDNSAEQIFADTVDAEIGDTVVYADYTVNGAAKNGWSNGSISTAAPIGSDVMETYEQQSKAENSMYLTNDGGTSYGYYDLPSDNFVAKVTFLEERGRDALVFVGVTDAAKTDLSLVKFPGSGRNAEVSYNQVHFKTKSWHTLDKNLYDLSVKGNPFTLYIYCYGETVYWVDLNGKLIYSEAFTAESGRKLMIAGSWTGIDLLSMQVKELSSIYSGGNGTEIDPFIIETAEQLYRTIGTFGGGKYYKLNGDIYLNDVEAIDWATGEIIKEDYAPMEWFHNEGGKTSNYVGSDGVTAGVFRGSIDGNGYAIHGIWYPNTSSYGVVGLLPDADKTTVKNLVLSHSYVRGYPKIAAISSRSLNGTFENVLIDENVTVKHTNTWTNSYTAGAFVGMSEIGGYLSFKNCASYAAVDNYGSSTNFGLVGSTWNTTTITAENCICIGTVPFGGDSNGSTQTTEKVAERFTQTNVYTDMEYSCKITCTDGTYTGIEFNTLTSSDAAKGQTAAENMSELFADDTVWYATTAEKYPQLLVWGAAHKDIDKSGTAIDSGDLAAIRLIIIGAKVESDYEWTEIDQNAGVDICDLVLLAK